MEKDQIQKDPSPIEIRYTEVGDAKYLKQWLLQPDVAHGFPMDDEIEVEDAVNRWISFYRYKCSLTATIDGVPCGLATLYLQPYRRLAHQCEMGIVVGDDNRAKGIGTQLMTSLMQLAKENFHIELLHLQVFAENPAVRFYRRFGFKEFGRQPHWVKQDGVYLGRIFMERFL